MEQQLQLPQWLSLSQDDSGGTCTFSYQISGGETRAVLCAAADCATEISLIIDQSVTEILRAEDAKFYRYRALRAQGTDMTLPSGSDLQSRRDALTNAPQVTATYTISDPEPPADEPPA